MNTNTEDFSEEDLKEIIAARIKLIFEDLNITKAKFYRKINCSRKGLDRMFDDNSVGILSIMRVCYAYNVNINFIFGITNNPFPYIIKNKEAFINKLNDLPCLKSYQSINKDTDYLFILRKGEPLDDTTIEYLFDINVHDNNNSIIDKISAWSSNMIKIILAKNL